MWGAPGAGRTYASGVRWSLRLGSVSGIDIRVHVTFALLVLLLAADMGDQHGSRGAVFGAVLVLSLFGCVVLHELGHSLVAQRFGVAVREIVLLPIGGVARLASEPRRPLHELLIALAGPLVNVVIAGVLYALLTFVGVDVLAEVKQGTYTVPGSWHLATALLMGNVSLAVFNMIPALPMDGGRVLRALLSMLVGHVRGTNIAAGLAQVLAIGLGIYGLQHQPMLAFLALLVFMAAGQERATTRASVLLAELRAGEVCDPHAVTFAPGDSVGIAVDQTLRSSQAHFLVTHGAQPLGTLSRDDIVGLAGRVGLHAPIATITRRGPVLVPSDMSLSELRRVLQENSGAPVVVMSEDGPLGVLGAEDVSRIASLTDALARGGIRRQVASNPETSTGS